MITVSASFFCDFLKKLLRCLTKRRRKEKDGLRANFLVDRLFKLLVVHYCSDLMIMMILFMMVVIMMMMGLA